MRSSAGDVAMIVVDNDVASFSVWTLLFGSADL